MNTKVSVVAMATVAMTLFVASAGVLSSSVIAQQSHDNNTTIALASYR